METYDTARKAYYFRKIIINKNITLDVVPNYTVKS